MPVGLSIDYRALQAAGVAVKRADRDLRRDITAEVKRATPLWQAEVAKRARTEQDRAMVKVGTRVASGNPPTLVAMSSRRGLPGGIVPARDYYMVEFGSPKEHGKRGQLPRRRKQGRIVYPAASAFVPVMCARWAQAIRDAYVQRARVGEETRG